MKSIIILPTYNEAENLGRLVTKILEVAPELDVLIIDDSSPDGTGKIADSLAIENFRVKAMHRSAKSGRGSATVTGFKYAIAHRYDFVLECDVDFSHPPEDIPKILEAAKEADLVIASRFVGGGSVSGWNWKRKLIHFAADMAVKAVLGTPNTDHTNGFRCYRIEKLKTFDLDKLGGFGYIGQTILENLFYRFGYRIEEVPTAFKDREMGVSKMGKSEMVNGMKAMLKLRWTCLTRGANYYRSL
jgi:dolichol-phosphate mannosyltransferase